MDVSVKLNLSNRKMNFGGHSWVMSSLYRERRSTVVLGDSPSIAEPNQYPCRMDILTLFTTNT